MSDPDEVQYSPYQECEACEVMAFEPERCFKCGLRCCSDCRGECEACGETFCNAEQTDKDGGCLEHHGCKRQADPADVMTLSGYYADNWVEQLDEVYRINGRTYVVVSPRGRSALEPPDVAIYRYDGIKSRDVWMAAENASGWVAVDEPKLEEVGRVDGTTGKTGWSDEQAEADHGEAE
jgi:hypothetical protein